MTGVLSSQLVGTTAGSPRSATRLEAGSPIVPGARVSADCSSRDGPVAGSGEVGSVFWSWQPAIPSARTRPAPSKTFLLMFGDPGRGWECTELENSSAARHPSYPQE